MGRWSVEVASLLLCLSRGCDASYSYSSNSNFDATIFGNSFNRDWLSGSYSLSMKVEGCVWGNVADSEEVGCLENDSEDGTTNWYMMANCKRPQVVVSIYADYGSSSGSCSSSNFVESFVTTVGLSEFIYYLQNFDSYSAFNSNSGGDYSYNALPNCESGGDGYVGLDCASDGSFQIGIFADEYCLTPTGGVYNNLYNLNSILSSNYKSCTDISNYGYISGNGKVYYNKNKNKNKNNQNNQHSYVASSFIEQLVYYSSESCSSFDYGYCKDSANFDHRRSHKSSGGGGSLSRQWSGVYLGSHKSWVTKLKYVVGGLFLLASFIMFTGILFTNRRRRRAMMMRKYRQSKKEKSREKSSSSRKSSRSRSRSKRSRSRPKISSNSAGGGEPGEPTGGLAAAEGVFT